MNPTKHQVAVTVGREPTRSYELTRAEIAEVWHEVKRRCLPDVKIGWYDETMRWQELQQRNRSKFQQYDN